MIADLRSKMSDLRDELEDVQQSFEDEQDRARKLGRDLVSKNSKIEELDSYVL